MEYKYKVMVACDSLCEEYEPPREMLFARFTLDKALEQAETMRDEYHYAWIEEAADPYIDFQGENND